MLALSAGRSYTRLPGAVSDSDYEPKHRGETPRWLGPGSRDDIRSATDELLKR
jgi:hypothetical protein